MKKIFLLSLLITFISVVSFGQDNDSIVNQKKKPKSSYRIGKASVTVWENKSKSGQVFKNFTVEKTYEKGGQWFSLSSFSETELLELKAVIDKAIAEESVKVK